MELKNQKVLVYGLGKSGLGAVKLLDKEGAEAILYDSSREKELPADLSQHEIILGDFPRTLISRLDLAVLSPGVPTDLPEIRALKAAGVPIIGEIELAYECGQGTVLAITGTNGKTTTTALLGEIMSAFRSEVYVVGNIGNAYTLAADQTTKDAVVVAEVSSFQLESIRDFRPRVSAILNITPDHLNRHHTMAAYIEAKFNVTKNQQPEDYCILNYEDEITRGLAERVRAQVIFFSSRRELERGIFLRDGRIIYKAEQETEIMRLDELQVLGTHNHENVMAAIAMALCCGVPAAVVRAAARAFKGVEHRIEYVREKDGVVYYNDSKGTNPDAAIKGIQAMNRPTVLIGGGYDKESTYNEWIHSFDGKVRKLILLGATKEKIAAACREEGFDDYQLAADFDEAVRLAVQTAGPGEAVLLSPACASWDMFPSYEIRGDRFKELVNQL